ncbi:MAG: cytidine deaminase [Flavobacteriaceae bacterium]|nr:cytidine deaminase [Flavobacteriaceae bacterium]
MHELKLESIIRVYENLQELSIADQTLVQSAKDATKQAYAPYSKFFVGAALLLESGEIITGSNQENAAYPSGLCAERVAFFSAGHQHKGKQILAVAIAVVSEEHRVAEPVIPCGACMQVMSEFQRIQQLPIRILLNGNNGKTYNCESLQTLMPLQFRL